MISTLLLAAVAVTYGGVIDAKRREIPNIVPVSLLLIGLVQCIVTQNWLPSLLGLLTPLIVMVVVSKITKQPTAGGDFKLLCTFGFATNLFVLLVALVLAFVLSAVYGVATHKPISRAIPLCTYFAAGYWLVLVFAILSLFVL